VDIREFVNSITGIPNNSGVVTQGQTGNNFIIAHPAPQQSELETSRRKSVVAKLRQEYVFSHGWIVSSITRRHRTCPTGLDE
jgi:hypothetical protein